LRTLVIETATAACSVALIEGDVVVAAAHEIVGRGHAERLVAMIAELPGGGRAESILVDCGPGSFTGIRVGIAAARGLGLGWGVPVAGYTSTALIAAAHFVAQPSLAMLAVVLEGGHGEVFMQSFSARSFAPLTALQSLRPEVAMAMLKTMTVVGNGVRLLPPQVPAHDWHYTLPSARDAALLPLSETMREARPIYGRAPDAKPMAAA